MVFICVNSRYGSSFYLARPTHASDESRFLPYQPANPALPYNGVRRRGLRGHLDGIALCPEIVVADRGLSGFQYRQTATLVHRTPDNRHFSSSLKTALLRESRERSARRDCEFCTVHATDPRVLRGPCDEIASSARSKGVFARRNRNSVARLISNPSPQRPAIATQKGPESLPAPWRSLAAEKNYFSPAARLSWYSLARRCWMSCGTCS